MAGKSRTGGRILVDQLRLQGVDTVFGVPGESYLEVLDALHDTPEIRFVVCRQEGGAAMMATAWGELTGRPGIAMVTRGPGATNASSGVHVAQQDSVPMILFVGQIDRGSRERDTFQEVDYRQMFGGMAKWVAEIDDPARIPEFVHRAFATATAGRPGPVVLALPEDMLVETAERKRWSPRSAGRACASAGGDGRAAPPAIDGRAAVRHRGRRRLERSGRRRLRALPRSATICRQPAGFRRQDLLDNEHRCYAGHIGLGPNPKLVERIKDSDLVLAIGARLGETTSQGFTLLNVPRPAQGLVHVHNDPEELGRVYQPDLAVLSGLNAFAQARRRAPAGSTPPLGRGHCGRACRGARLEPPDPDRGRAAAWGGRRLAARASPGRRDPDQRRRQLRDLGQPAFRLSRSRDPARPRFRLDGLRPAGRRRRQAALPRAAGRLLRGRRLLSHDRARAGDRRPVPAAAGRNS